MIEHREGLEFRVQGRTLTGIALRYGDVSPDYRERFEPGAFAPIGDVALNLQHDSERVLARTGNGLVLADSPRALELRAELTGRAELDLVRRGALSGFSIEFHAKAERREAGVRVVERAELTGIALCDRGAYPQSKAEVRARGGRGGRLGTIRGSIPVGKRLSCRCSPGDCVEAIFEDGAFNAAIDKHELLAITGEFSDTIASKRRNGLRVWLDDDGSMQYAIDIPSTDRGRALVDGMKVADHYGRPVLDRELSEVIVEGTVATYQRAEVRAILVGPTDVAAGWDPVKMTTAEKVAALSKISQRRARLWL